MAKYRQRSEWQILVNSFLQSTDTMKNYCTQNNLNFRSFQNWYYKLKPRNKRPVLTKNIKSIKTIKTNNTKFIRLTLPPSERITIKLPNGINLEFISNNILNLVKELSHAI